MVKVLFRRPCHVPPCLINGEGGSSSDGVAKQDPVTNSRSCYIITSSTLNRSMLRAIN